VTSPSRTSYWLEEPREQWSDARFEGRAEVAVIGGGVTGCSCALTLAKRGVRVRLYEAGEIAGGASGRNGGFALRGAATPYDVAQRELGAERARRLMELTERSLDRMEALAGDAFRRVGSLRLAADDAELQALRREHDALAADGFDVEWVEELTEPLDRLYRGAIRHPPDGALHPARWVRRLAARAAAAGADIREHEPATVDHVDADAVVVAGDGFTAALLPELAPVVRPIRGQVLATEPLDELRYACPHYARDGYDYWHQLPDRRLVIGGCRDASLSTEETDVLETTELIQARLESLAGKLTGGSASVTHRWAGIWGTTPDLLPLVGAAPGREGVWLAGGYSGHGNALGLACGELVALAVVGEQAPELELFEPSRFAVVAP
jgi:glycine/D-amino acid oxidase-like deaminating enzyme